jgi:hypothetical protein
MYQRCTYFHGSKAGLIWSSLEVVFQNWCQCQIKRHKTVKQHPVGAHPCSHRCASWMRWLPRVLWRSGNRCSCPMSIFHAVTPYKRALWHQLVPVLATHFSAWPCKRRWRSSLPSRPYPKPSLLVITPILASCCLWHCRFPCIYCSRWTHYCSWQPWLCWFFSGLLQSWARPYSPLVQRPLFRRSLTFPMSLKMNRTKLVRLLVNKGETDNYWLKCCFISGETFSQILTFLFEYFFCIPNP